MRLMHITQMWRTDKRMEEYKNISKELQRMLERAEELGWSYTA